MPEASLLLARSLKLLAEVAFFAWLGQWALGAMLGAGRERNVVHTLFMILLRPFRWVAEHGLPARWPLPWRRRLVGFCVALAWCGALAWKIHLCLGTTWCG